MLVFCMAWGSCPFLFVAAWYEKYMRVCVRALLLQNPIITPVGNTTTPHPHPPSPPSRRFGTRIHWTASIGLLLRLWRNAFMGYLKSTFIFR
jgi:hypothetical protein